MEAGQRARQRVLQRVEDDERAREAGQAHAARLDHGEAVGERLPEPRGAAVGQPRRIDGGHARGGEQVLGALAQRERLQRRGQQQHAQRPVLPEQLGLLGDPPAAEARRRAGAAGAARCASR